MIARRWRALPLAFAVVTCLGGARSAAAADDYEEAVLATGEVPEEELLDVAIDLFSPSVDQSDREELAEQGTRPSVRKSEARFLPVQLRNTLQSTGQWGVVRVVPAGAPWAELSVLGRIVKSNGKELQVEISAWDATGEKWLDRDYEHKVGELAYAREKIDRLDPFQSLYNEIANDLVKERDDRKRAELVRVREVAQLRFAAEFAPDTFGPYLETDRKGHYRVLRLPAQDDPMMGRLSLIGERDHLFVDTLNEYYTDFHARMSRSYDDWRAYSYTEQVPLDSLKKSSLIKKIIGGVAVVAGILLPADDCRDSRDGSGREECRRSRTKEGAKEVLVMGGIAAIQSGAQDAAESGIHKEALEELVDSFDADLTPLLVDVDGKITQLTGSAESQFTQWRELLRQIAHADSALPGDINVAPMSVAVVVTPPPPSSGDPLLPEADGSGDEPATDDSADPAAEPGDEDVGPSPAGGPLPNLAPATGLPAWPAPRP